MSTTTKSTRKPKPVGSVPGEEPSRDKRAARAERTRERAAELTSALPDLTAEGRKAVAAQVSEAAITVSESMERTIAPFFVCLLVIPLLLAVPAVWLVSAHRAQLRADGAGLSLTIGCGGAILFSVLGVSAVAWGSRHRRRVAEPPRHRPAPLLRRLGDLAPVALALALSVGLIPVALIIVVEGERARLPRLWWLDALDGAALALVVMTVAWLPLRVAQARREVNLSQSPAGTGAVPDVRGGLLHGTARR